MILRSSIRNFGYKRNIHVWIRKEDYENASLMILLSYIILGHKDWSQGEIKIFAIFSEKDLETEKQHLIDLTTSGRLPISPSNIKVISQYDGMNHQDTINEYSADADLTLVGFHESVIKAKGEEFLNATIKWEISFCKYPDFKIHHLVTPHITILYFSQNE